VKAKPLSLVQTRPDNTCGRAVVVFRLLADASDSDGCFAMHMRGKSDSEQTQISMDMLESVKESPQGPYHDSLGEV